LQESTMLKYVLTWCKAEVCIDRERFSLGDSQRLPFVPLQLHLCTDDNQETELRVRLDWSPGLPSQIIGVDQMDGRCLDCNQFFGVPRITSAIQYNFTPMIWLDMGGRKPRQYFGCQCIGRAELGKNQTYP
jgi:hypothetical protein